MTDSVTCGVVGKINPLLRRGRTLPPLRLRRRGSVPALVVMAPLAGEI